MRFDARVRNLDVQRGAGPVLDFEKLLWTVRDLAVSAGGVEVYKEIGGPFIELSPRRQRWGAGERGCAIHPGGADHP